MIDHRIGPQFVRRPIAEAERHGDDGNARRARGRRIGQRVADKRARRDIATGGGDRGTDMPRIGLGRGDAVETEIGREAIVPSERGDQPPRQRHRLVGANGEAAAGGGQRIERRDHAGPRARSDRDIVGVEGEERCHPGFDQFRRHRPRRRQPAFEQPPRTMADEVAHRVGRQRRAAQHAQRVVERRRQIGRGIDEGAVEIEDDGGGQAAHRRVMRRGRFPRQGRYGRARGVTDTARQAGPAATRPLAAVVLAAGQGTRMKSTIHKVLHPIAGRAMLLHLLDSLATLSPQRTVVVVGAGRDQVEAAVAPLGVATALQEPQLGTGHAVLQARDALAGFDGDVLILYGDVPLVSAATMARMLDALTPATAAVVLGFRPADAAAYGRVLADGDTIVKMVEHKDADAAERAVTLCNSGLMAVRSDDLWPLLARIGNANAAGEYYLVDLPNLAIGDGRRCRVVETGADEVAGVNSRAELAAMEARWQAARRERAMADGVTLTDPGSVFFAFDTVIDRDVGIEPNVVFGPGVRVASATMIRAHSHIAGAIIGEGCEIGPFARLRPGTVLGNGAKIGNFVETKKAVFGDGAKANHLSYLGDADIGAHANIGAGTITCNYDGYLKYPTVIGAGAFIGSNSALVAPVTIGAGAIVGAGAVVTTDVPADALALVRPARVTKAGWASRFRAVMSARKAGAAPSH